MIRNIIVVVIVFTVAALVHTADYHLEKAFQEINTHRTIKQEQLK